MVRILAAALVVSILGVLPAATQEPEPLSKSSINLGPLAEAFTLVSAELSYEPGTGSKITLKLQAKKDVDTSEFNCQAGFFDRAKLLLQASPVFFQAGFPLLKGEYVNAYCIYPGPPFEDGFPWYQIIIRAAKKPA
jgi:hypothetical protein